MRRAVLFLCLLAFCLCSGAVRAEERKIWEIDFSRENTPSQIAVEARYCFSFGEHTVFYARDSSLSITFVLDKAEGSGYFLKITDRASMNRMAMAESSRYGIFSPLSIKINGSLAVGYVDVNWLNDTASEYDVGSFLKQGKNTVEFMLAAGSLTRYEVARVELLSR